MRSAIALALLLAVVVVVSGCTSNPPEPTGPETTGRIVQNQTPPEFPMRRQASRH